MRLSTVKSPTGQERVMAEIDKGAWHDISDLFPSMLDLIRAGSAGLKRVYQGAGSTREVDGDLPPGVIAPIPHPGRDVYCVGWNYLKHFNEGIGRRGNQEAELPDYPTFFSKATRSVIGPYDPVPYDHEFTEKLDYEAEIAVIIGREGKNIKEEQARDYIFGLTLANDVSARDVQRRHGGQWLKGKSMDGACPLGPAIVTLDDIPDFTKLNIQGLVNDEVRQEARLSQLIFSIPRLIAELSWGMTLLPGDILLTGTPDGVGFAMTPPQFLKPGDRLVVQSDALGRLENRVGPDIHEMR